MIKRLLLLIVFLTGAGLSAETPREGAKAILELVKDRNYAVIFNERYAEWHKVEDAKRRPEEAIQKLSLGWELNRDMVLSIFKQLSKADYEIGTNPDPQESETGEIAVTTVIIGDRTIPYQLYKLKSGLWGFHM